jgi:prophage maintenance system killer protein
MTEHDDPSVARLLARLRFDLRQAVDFTRSDSETTRAKVRLLTAAARYFNILAVTEFGGRSGRERAEGLVEQVVAAAFQTFGGEDPHPTRFARAAMLLRGITQGHPFTDGNKRTGYLLATYYLDRVGYIPRADLNLWAVVTFCRRISAGEIRDIHSIAEGLAEFFEPRRETPVRIP